MASCIKSWHGSQQTNGRSNVNTLLMLWSYPCQLTVLCWPDPLLTYTNRPCLHLPTMHQAMHPPPSPPKPLCHPLPLLLTADMAVQERQRRGIPGVHMRSLDEHLDQQDLQKLLGEVIHHTRASTDHPAPNHQALAKVAISRQVLMSLLSLSSRSS